MNPPPPSFRERVLTALEAALQERGSVGPLELFEFLRALPSQHIQAWRRGQPGFEYLENLIHLGPAKYRTAVQVFQEWIQERGLRAVEATYVRTTTAGPQNLPFSKTGDPALEKFYRTHYVPADLTITQQARVQKKLNKAPDLVVHIITGRTGSCAECQAELGEGDYITLEKEAAVCLACADLDHLVFLPAGDTALTRRARKLSSLAAVVVRFNRRRGRYERQGLLVTAQAIDDATAQCNDDAPERAQRRAQAAVYREKEDQAFTDSFAQAVGRLFPLCPPASALEIAQHTARRGSGRVGRSAAGRALDDRAVKLAVIAHIRHTHTNYDALLMEGVERHEARARIARAIDQVLTRWQPS